MKRHVDTSRDDLRISPRPTNTLEIKEEDIIAVLELPPMPSDARTRRPPRTQSK